MSAVEQLIGELSEVCAGLPDQRKGLRHDRDYTMADIGLSAFSIFFMGSPSFLAHQRQLEEGHGRSNCASLFGIAKIPSDNHIRDMLDPAAPALLRPVFAETIEQLRQIDGGLDMFRRLDGRVLIALHGTEPVAGPGGRLVPAICSGRVPRPMPGTGPAMTMKVTRNANRVSC